MRHNLRYNLLNCKSLTFLLTLVNLSVVSFVYRPRTNSYNKTVQLFHSLSTNKFKFIHLFLVALSVYCPMRMNAFIYVCQFLFENCLVYIFIIIIYNIIIVHLYGLHHLINYHCQSACRTSERILQRFCIFFSLNLIINYDLNVNNITIIIIAENSSLFCIYIDRKYQHNTLNCTKSFYFLL